MSQSKTYCWVVRCKNRWFHLRRRAFNPHRIALAVTDAASPCPALGGDFRVRCDDCGKIYFYKPTEVFRRVQRPLIGFTTHPLFREQ